MMATYDAITETKPLDFRLAYIADLEATFTPSFKLLLDNEETLFRPGDDRVASLLLWHFVEEVKHRRSALVIYNAVVASRTYRLRAIPAVIRHIGSLLSIYIEGMNEHVPQNDRVLDARTMSMSWRIGQQLRRIGREGHKPAGGMLSAVPRRNKVIAIRRLLMSQNPFHNPADEPLPRFADHWFERYERGDDIPHWYTSQIAS